MRILTAAFAAAGLLASATGALAAEYGKAFAGRKALNS